MDIDTKAILNNLKNAFEKLCRQRMIVSSPNEKVADVPVIWALLLLLATPVPCVIAFVLGLIRHYDLRFEQELERRG